MSCSIYCYAEYHHADCRYAEFCYAKCRYAECHYAECRYAECRYAKCCYAECHVATKIIINFVKTLILKSMPDVIYNCDKSKYYYTFKNCN